MGRPEDSLSLIRCAYCSRELRPDENLDDEWRVESDGVGELHVFCPECWKRRFGEAGSQWPM